MRALYISLLCVEIFFAIIVFFILFKVTAPYGKFLRKGWGVTIKSKFGWMIMESPSVFIIAGFYIYSNGWHDVAKNIFLMMWLAHYFHRAFIYPFTISGGNKPYPLLLVIFAIIFNLMNGYVNGYEVFYSNFYSEHWLSGFPFIFGTTIFIIGYVINKHSDKILSQLKNKSNGEYKIPYGGLFNWVSAPHYFGEIVEWVGWAILTWSISGWVFALFTFANLAPRAVTSHKWYLENFRDYPRSRRALIPRIW